MDLSVLKPFLMAELQQVVDSVVFPELEKVIKENVSNPLLQPLLLQILPALKAAADSEIVNLSK